MFYFHLKVRENSMECVDLRYVCTYVANSIFVRVDSVIEIADRI